jgi:hypothetical protein
MVVEVVDAPPQAFRHCEDVYKAMRKASTIVEEEGQRWLIWEGRLTKLINEELGLPTPYYTAIRSSLARMGCIRQVQRGGGTSPSKWEIIKAPTLDAYKNAQPEAESKPQGRLAQAEQRISDLLRRVELLEEGQKLLVSAYNSLAQDQDQDSDEAEAS